MAELSEIKSTPSINQMSTKAAEAEKSDPLTAIEKPLHPYELEMDWVDWMSYYPKN